MPSGAELKALLAERPAPEPQAPDGESLKALLGRAPEGGALGAASLKALAAGQTEVPDEDPGLVDVALEGARQGLAGLAESVYATPETLKRFLVDLPNQATDAAIEALGGEPETWNPRVGNPLQPIIDWSNRRGEAIERWRQYGGGEAAKALAAKSEQADSAVNAALQGNFAPLGEVVTDPAAWAGFIGQAAPSLAGSLLSGGSLKFIGWMEALEASKDAQEFEERTGEAIDPDEFARAVTMAGTVNALLEKAGVDRILKSGQGSALVRAMKSGAAEATTEAVQAGSSNLAARTYDENRNLSGGVLAGAMGGFGTGAAAGGALGALEPSRPEPPPKGVLDEGMIDRLGEQLRRAQAENRTVELTGPDPTLRADPEGNVGTERQFEERRQREADLGMTSGTRRAAERHLGRAEPAAPMAAQPSTPRALPAPERTLYGTPEGELGREHEIRRREAERRELGLDEVRRARQGRVPAMAERPAGALDEDVLRADNTPFRSANDARVAAQSRRLGEDYRPVEIGRGEWVLRRVEPLPPPAAEPAPVEQVAAAQSERTLDERIAELERGLSEADGGAIREALRAELERLQKVRGQDRPKLTAAERAREARRVDPGRDDLLTAIQKLGGLDTALENDWAGRLGRGARAPGLPALERPGKGESLDALAERLFELGYLSEFNQSELAEKLSRAEQGEPVYSIEREEAALDRDIFEAERARNALEAPADELDMDELMSAWRDYAEEGTPGEQYAPDAYEPDADDTHRILTDVARLAQDVSPERAERIIEEGARRGASDAELITELLAAVREDANARAEREDEPERRAATADAGASAPRAPGRPAAEAEGEREALSLEAEAAPAPVAPRPTEQQADAFGGRTDAEQTIFDRERARERAEREAPDAGAVDGLFSGQDRQTDIDDAANEAATSPANDLPEPTDAQKEAGNYRVGHLRIQGLDISIENPRGSMRSGVDGDGRRWESELKDHYGYIRGTEGRDGDAIDVFLGPNPQRPDTPVFVVDQVDPETGRFDEHKVVLGADSREEAERIYRRNYEDGWQGLGGLREFTLPEFKLWLKQGNTKRRVTRSNEARDNTESVESPGGRYVTKGQRARARAGQGGSDLFSQTGSRADRPSDDRNVQPASAVPGEVTVYHPPSQPDVAENIQRRVRAVEVARLPSGVDTVRSAGDAAHVIAQLRKRAQEHLYALVTDGEGRVLSVIEHTIGGPNAAAAYPEAMLPAIHAVPGARTVWFAHNHPSGNPNQSGADRNLTERFYQLLRGTGVESAGMLVVAPGSREATVYARDDVGAWEERRVPITARARNRASVPVTRREFRLFRPGERTVDGPEAARDVMMSMDGEGVALLDNRNSVVGWLPMSAEQMKKLRTGQRGTGASRLMQALGDTNANTMIAKVSDWRSDEGREALINLATFSNQMGFQFLDAFDRHGDSSAERGALPGTRSDNYFSLRGVEQSRESADEARPRAGLPASGLRDALDGLMSEWYDAPEVQVLQGESDLPPVLQDSITKAGASGEVRGIYWRERVFLIADNLRSVAEAQETLLHEVVGHYGLRKLLGEKFIQLLDDVYLSVGRRRLEPIAKVYGLDLDNRQQRRTATEEYLAHLAQTNPKSKLWDRFVHLFRDWMRRMGVRLRLTRAEIRDLIVRARHFVESGERVTGTSVVAEHALYRGTRHDEVNFSRTDTEAFRRWFGDSKVVDEDGDPRVVYHGTASDITRFKKEMLGANTKAKSAESAYFFAASPTVASGYAVMATPEPRMRVEALERQLESGGLEQAEKGRIERELDRAYEESTQAQRLFIDGDVMGGANVIPSFLKIENPLVIDHQGGDYRPVGFNEAIERARKEGRDGVIFKNVNDSMHAELDEATDVFAVFDDTQIKSAIGNRGTFDPDNPDIRFSRRDTDPTLAEAMRRAGLGQKRGAVGQWAERIQALTAARARNIARELLDATAQGSVDRFHGIKRAELAHVGNLPAEQSAYVAARLSTGIASTMRAILHHGAPQWKNGIIGRVDGSKGLLDVLDPVKGDLETFLGWMVARRAQRLMQEGRENLFEQQHIDALVKAGEASALYGRFEQTGKELDAFKKHILDLAEEAGLIDPDTRAAWDQADYIPFYRVAEADSVQGPQGRGALTGQSSGIRALKGGSAALNDPLENLLMNFTHLVDAAMKNHAIRQVRRNLDGEGVLEAVPPQFKQELIPLDQVRARIREQGGDPDLLPPQALQGMAKLWAMKVPADPDVVRIMEDGKAHYYRVTDPLLLRALTAVRDPGLNHPIVRVMRAFKRILTRGVTADPAFMARNFVRDMLHAWTINEDNFRLGVDSIRGVTKTLQEKGGAIDMMYAGGSFLGGYVNANDPGETARAIRAALRQKGFNAADRDAFVSTVIDTPAKWWEVYTRIGDSVENASREAVFEAGKKAGKTDAQAIFEAKDLMDYSLRGDWAIIQFFGDVLPFFNARLQGLYKLGRAGYANPQRIAARGSLIALASLALLARNWEDERYEELPEWDKDTYWHIFLPESVVGADYAHIRIPKPFEVGVLFGTWPERIARNLGGRDDNEKTLERFLWSLRETFAFDPAPQAINPIIEVGFNWDRWRDAPIEGLADQGLLPQARYDEQTSATMRALGQITGPSIGLSPKELEHLWGGYTGTLGMYALAVSDVASRALMDMPPRPELRLDDYPVVGTFLRSEPARSTKYLSALYELHQEANEIYRTIREYRKTGQREKAQALLEAERPKLRVRQLLLKGADLNSKIRKRMDAVYRSKDMTPAEKRREIDRLLKIRNERMEAVMEKADAFLEAREGG